MSSDGRHYQLHREEILAKAKAKRMADPEYQNRTAMLAEKQWIIRGLIWRTLARRSSPTTASQIAVETGYTRATIHNHLNAMPGVERVEYGLWRALGVTDEWEEILDATYESDATESEL